MKRFPEVTLPFFRLPPLKQTRWNRHRLSVCWPLSARANRPRSLHVNKAHLPERPGDATPRQLLPSPHQGAPSPRPGQFPLTSVPSAPPSLQPRPPPGLEGCGPVPVSECENTASPNPSSLLNNDTAPTTSGASASSG